MVDLGEIVILGSHPVNRHEPFFRKLFGKLFCKINGRNDLINKDIIASLKPCSSKFDNYLKHYKDFNGDLFDFILLENITYSDKIWVVTRLFTKEQNAKWSLLCASKVLSIFEQSFPNDDRPRRALEAAEQSLNNPTKENSRQNEEEMDV